ncbi:18737_t:CDS:1, partial [Gigaspora rosea]
FDIWIFAKEMTLRGYANAEFMKKFKSTRHPMIPIGSLNG